MGFVIQGIRFTAIMGITLGVMLGGALAQTTLPWRGNLITITAEEEPIKEILRTILRANGMIAIFKGKVDGTVDLDEEDVPAAGIFNQLITEFNLQYVYNDTTKTVVIESKRVAAAAAAVAPPVRDFVVPQYVNFAVIRSVLGKFGLGTSGITYDDASGTISLFGKADRISDIKLLIENLDKAAENRQVRQLNDQRAEYEGQLYKALLSAKVKVIRLRYATVGSTTKTFQGKSVSIPGIEETLQAILGVQIRRAGDTTAVPAPLVLAGGGGAGANVGGQRGLALGQAAALLRLKELTKPTISVDPRTNSVIVRGSETAIAEVEEVIRQLDKPQRMIEIEVIILAATKGVIENLGISFRGQTNNTPTGNSTSKGFGIDTSGTVTGTGKATTDSRGTDAVTLLPSALAGSLIASFITARPGEDFLQVQLAALSQDDKTQTIASPRLITLDNVAASITNARNVFIQTTESGESGTTVQAIPTGLSINILPTIVPSDVAGQEEFIRLSFNATNSNPAEVATGGLVDVQSQEIQTEVLIPDGGTYVVGGLTSDTRKENVTGLPGLRELPFIGQLFRTNLSSDSFSEIIFLITPRIVQSDDLLSRDIAARIGTRDYINRQRAALTKMKADLVSHKDQFPYALRHLVEDE
jgi:type IV pilus assembly protein PilQ